MPFYYFLPIGFPQSRWDDSKKSVWESEFLMTILTIFQWAFAAGTVITGFISLLWPLSIRGFTGLVAEGGRGKTEIRAVMGGVFLALGLAPLLFDTSTAFKILGFTYLVIGLVRVVSIYVDRSFMRSNILSLAVEFVFGVVLIL